MSKWGEEEKETLEAIENAHLTGTVLNLAAGDGRFTNALLEHADKVIAFDMDLNELKQLEETCKKELKEKLVIQKGDIKSLPFQNGEFDSVFCTGTLHLFKRQDLQQILGEVSRVLKPNGKLIFDFATDIIRYDKNRK